MPLEIIPTCTGNTQSGRLTSKFKWDHPRTCGEHSTVTISPLLSVGSSPHVRGARLTLSTQPPATGIIPACAGSTPLLARIRPIQQGSSPHVRGAHLDRRLPRRESGIIPACAGSTWPASPPWHSSWDHPRMCGEHFIFGGDLPLTEGSSPHVRGAP